MSLITAFKFFGSFGVYKTSIIFIIDFEIKQLVNFIIRVEHEKNEEDQILFKFVNSNLIRSFLVHSNGLFNLS